jgi:hypothetical protein
MQLQSLPNAEDMEERAADVAEFFAKLRSGMDKRIASAIKKTVKVKNGNASLDRSVYAFLPPVIAQEMIAKLICELTGDDHPPRTQKLERLCAWMANPKPTRASLAHLSFEYEKKRDIISIYPPKRP